MRRKAAFLLDSKNLMHYNIHMDLEKLNKTQIILLVLLVSFVTSIATGIVTVTLMDQAPPAITHTINRVVEHTVEKVVPVKTQGATTVKTVIVKEESLVADAVQKNSGNVVEIFIHKDEVLSANKEDTEEKELLLGEFVALSFMVSSDGMMIADSALISNKGSYAAKMSDGTLRKISLLTQDEEKGVAILAIDKDIEDATGFSAPPLADSDSVKLGQSVISINKKKDIVVSTGIVSRFSAAITTDESSNPGTSNCEFSIA